LFLFVRNCKQKQTHTETKIMMSSHPRGTDRAVQSATAAVRAEQAGDLRSALSLYTEAASGLIAAAKVELDEDRRMKIHASAADALQAAERVRSVVDAQAVSRAPAYVAAPAPALRPAPPPKPFVSPSAAAAVATVAASPAFASMVAGQFDSRADRSVVRDALGLAGTGLVSAARTVYDLDQEHDIHQKVGAGLRTTFAKATELEREYQVRERMMLAAQRARELNEKHHIDEKAS
jgi:hypothetical protein